MSKRGRQSTTTRESNSTLSNSDSDDSSSTSSEKSIKQRKRKIKSSTSAMMEGSHSSSQQHVFMGINNSSSPHYHQPPPPPPPGAYHPSMMGKNVQNQHQQQQHTLPIMGNQQTIVQQPVVMNNQVPNQQALKSRISSEQVAYCPSCSFIGNKSHLPQSISSVNVETNFNSQTVSMNECYESIYHQFVVKVAASRPFHRMCFYLNYVGCETNSKIVQISQADSLEGPFCQLQIVFSSIYLSSALLTEPLISSQNLPFLNENSARPFIQFGNVECRGNEILIPLQFLSIDPEKYFQQQYQITNPNANIDFSSTKSVIGAMLDIQLTTLGSTITNGTDCASPVSTLVSSSTVSLTFPYSVNRSKIVASIPSNLMQSDLPLIYHDIRQHGKGTLLWYPIHVPFLSNGLKLLCLLAHNTSNDKHKDLFGRFSNDNELRYLNVGSLLLEFINGLMSEQKKKYSYVYEMKNQSIFPMNEKKTVKILTHSNLHRHKIGDEACITNNSFWIGNSDINVYQNKCIVKVLQYGVCKKAIVNHPYDSFASTEEDDIEIVYFIEYPTSRGPKNMFVSEGELHTLAGSNPELSKEEIIKKESNDKLYNEALQQVYNINAQDLLNLEKKYQLQQLNEEQEYHQTNHFKGDLHLHGNLLLKGHLKIQKQASCVERVIMNVDLNNIDYYMLFVDSIPSDVPIKVMLCMCTKFTDTTVRAQPITILETPNYFIYPRVFKSDNVVDIWFECRSIGSQEKLESTTPLPFRLASSTATDDNNSEPLVPLAWQHFFMKKTSSFNKQD